ncbi:hypothetical protein RFI_01245 [Reticulomyxa filosa]|uniref:SUI1 domain-containing protein n=1 Tax=Reticulomyxa filosa TaxID=46433 RepID=X6PDS4_RETFI|nr:hypothetical protein RFI_01245 [Reticulomyxa filosa]|eukprot:ETO35817.1 hypothetical protein RFI_01245 [Reticulomyxa filosa]
MLPWNKWKPSSYREAIYKYVNEQDYKMLRKHIPSKGNNLEVSTRPSVDIPKNDEPTEKYHELVQKYGNIDEYDIPKESSQTMPTTGDIDEPMHTYSYEENPSYASFQPQLWTKYAYKTFIIDRTKSGNLPVYYHFQPNTRTYITEDFCQCLQAYLGKDADVVLHAGSVTVHGKAHLEKVKKFIIKMGF